MHTLTIQCVPACSCAKSLAHPGEITIDDVQLVLYGRDLGLTLPLRDVFSTMTSEHVKQHMLPWLDTIFTSSAPVSVMERLAAMAGYHDTAPGGVHPGAPPSDAQRLRVHELQAAHDEDDTGNTTSDGGIDDSCDGGRSFGEEDVASDDINVTDCDSDSEDEDDYGPLRGGVSEGALFC